MTIEQFCKTITPPIAPFEKGRTEEWQEIEREIGIKLPEDYKNLIDIFGTGCFAHFIWIFNPFTKNKNLNLLKQIHVQLDALKILEKQFGNNCPYPIYPESNGLLPLGVTDNGDILFWLTEHDSNEWEVVVREARGSEYEEFETGVTGFLQDLIIGDIHSAIIPRQLLDQDTLFQPLSRI